MFKMKKRYLVTTQLYNSFTYYHIIYPEKGFLKTIRKRDKIVCKKLVFQKKCRGRAPSHPPLPLDPPLPANISFETDERLSTFTSPPEQGAEGASAPSPPTQKFSVDVPFFADEPFKYALFERRNQKCT